MGCDERWHKDAEEYGWVMPAAPRWKRLPVIRYFRYVWLAWLVHRHYTSGIGTIGIPTGYDSWVLYGIYKGWERHHG